MNSKKLKRLILTLTALIFVVAFSHANESSTIDAILRYTNDYRKSKGKPMLVMDSAVNKEALNHTLNMASGKTPLGHEGFADRIKRLKSNGSFGGAAAENVAYGYMSAKEVVNGWINSATHRKNMLGDFTHIGIAAVTDKNGRTYFTQIFIRRN